MYRINLTKKKIISFDHAENTFRSSLWIEDSLSIPIGNGRYNKTPLSAIKTLWQQSQYLHFNEFDQRPKHQDILLEIGTRLLVSPHICFIQKNLLDSKYWGALFFTRDGAVIALQSNLTEDQEKRVIDYLTFESILSPLGPRCSSEQYCKDYNPLENRELSKLIKAFDPRRKTSGFYSPFPMVGKKLIGMLTLNFIDDISLSLNNFVSIQCNEISDKTIYIESQLVTLLTSTFGWSNENKIANIKGLMLLANQNRIHFSQSINKTSPDYPTVFRLLDAAPFLVGAAGINRILFADYSNALNNTSQAFIQALVVLGMTETLSRDYDQVYYDFPNEEKKNLKGGNLSKASAKILLGVLPSDQRMDLLSFLEKYLDTVSPLYVALKESVQSVRMSKEIRSFVLPKYLPVTDEEASLQLTEALTGYVSKEDGLLPKQESFTLSNYISNRPYYESDNSDFGVNEVRQIQQAIAEILTQTTSNDITLYTELTCWVENNRANKVYSQSDLNKIFTGSSTDVYTIINSEKILNIQAAKSYVDDLSHLFKRIETVSNILESSTSPRLKAIYRKTLEFTTCAPDSKLGRLKKIISNSECYDNKLTRLEIKKILADINTYSTLLFLNGLYDVIRRLCYYSSLTMNLYQTLPFDETLFFPNILSRKEQNGSVFVVEKGHNLQTLLDGKGAKSVPNSVSLNSNNSRILFLLGGTTSGKSHCLEMIHYIYLLAAAGLPVPAASVSLTLPDRVEILKKYESKDNNGLSQFQAEANSVMKVLQVPGYPLLLFDEVLTGTMSEARIEALSRLIAYIMRNTNALSIIVTHESGVTDHLRSKF